MEREREEDQGGVGRVLLGGCEARHAATVRMTADDGRRVVGNDAMERRQRLLGLALREVDGRRLEPATLKAVDERLHARRGARGTVPDVAVEWHQAGSVAFGDDRRTHPLLVVALERRSSGSSDGRL